MNVLLYRYGSICEPDMIAAFQKLNLQVIEVDEEITNKTLTAKDQVALVAKYLDKYHPVFVFSINFFPAIAEVCHIYHVKYVCWSVDSPVLELFSNAIRYDTNRIFLFDQAQYNTFASYNPEGIFYLPLASAVERFDSVLGELTLPTEAQTSVASVTEAYKKPSAKHLHDNSTEYLYDISFVGSLYNEKNKMHTLTKPLPEKVKGYVDGVCAAALKVYGYNFLESVVNDDVIKALKECSSRFYQIDTDISGLDTYVAANDFLGIQVTELERIQTLNVLANFFSVDLFTRSDSSMLQNVHVHEGIRSLDEMPRVFRQSKINLNLTSKSIQTGLPLRIFDIMGCGGFVMTNYQAELSQVFEIGVDLEAYGSMEELVDKCQYYLTHEEERLRIAQKGYETVKTSHTYIHRIKEMLGKY